MPVELKRPYGAASIHWDALHMEERVFEFVRRAILI